MIPNDSEYNTNTVTFWLPKSSVQRRLAIKQFTHACKLIETVIMTF